MALRNDKRGRDIRVARRQQADNSTEWLRSVKLEFEDKISVESYKLRARVEGHPVDDLAAAEELTEYTVSVDNISAIIDGEKTRTKWSEDDEGTMTELTNIDVSIEIARITSFLTVLS